ncbi:MAG: hypothetical protein GVY19_14400 [Bacteroidetes bacterium]|jgi:arginase family enzyme|nr:hypothetical protein [Bacteroidota bacterium]
MNIIELFDPVALEKPPFIAESPNLFSRNIQVNTESHPIESLKGVKVVIMGVMEDRNSYNTGSSLSPDHIRSSLYQLYRNNHKLAIADLGNLKAGNTFHDTYAALKWVLAGLFEQHIMAIVLGGTQDLTIPIYESYEKINEKVNIAVVDPRIDADLNNTDNYRSHSFLNTFLFPLKMSLEQFSLIGLQEYYADSALMNRLDEYHFDYQRLGVNRQKITSVEPVFRDSHIVSIDVSAIRQSELMGHFYPSPNGFNGEEICRLSRLAGLSNNIKCLGLFELNPRFDVNNQSASLCAQIIWYFLEGYGSKIIETPKDDDNQFKKFLVKSDESDHEIVFYKSLHTQRWWMQIPIVNSRHYRFISCTVDDYNQACNHEVPDKWLKAYQRLN